MAALTGHGFDARSYRVIRAHIQRQHLDTGEAIGAGGDPACSKHLVAPLRKQSGRGLPNTRRCSRDEYHLLIRHFGPPNSRTLRFEICRSVRALATLLTDSSFG